MAQIITIANNKGGTGKTATAIAIAAGFAQRGKRTLLVDLDAQVNATLALRIPTAAGTCFDLLRGTPVQPAQIGANLWGIGSTRDMNIIDRQVDISKGTAVAAALKQYAAQYEFIILDTPPAMGLLTINSLNAADNVVIPLQASYLALQGMGVIMEALQALKKAQAYSVVVTMYDGRKTLHRQLLEAIKNTYGSAVVSTPIRSNVALQEAPASGSSIFEYAPKSIGAQDYRAVVEELLKKYE